MSVFGSSVKEISVENDDIGQIFIFPVDGEENTLNLGGYRNDDTVQLDGAGRAIFSKKQVTGMFEGPIINDMATSREYNAMVACAASTSDTTFTFTLVNGEVFSGIGGIVGDLDMNTYKSSFQLTVKGARFQQQ